MNDNRTILMNYHFREQPERPGILKRAGSDQDERDYEHGWIGKAAERRAYENNPQNDARQSPGCSDEIVTDPPQTSIPSIAAKSVKSTN